MYLLPEVKKKEERAGRYCLPFNGEIAVDLSVKEESRGRGFSAEKVCSGYLRDFPVSERGCDGADCRSLREEGDRPCGGL